MKNTLNPRPDLPLEACVTFGSLGEEMVSTELQERWMDGRRYLALRIHVASGDPDGINMVALRDQLTYKKLRLSARYPNIKFTGEDALEADAVWVVLNFMDGDNGHLKATVSKGVKVRLYDADYLTCVCLHGTGRDALEHVEVAWMTYVDSNNTTAFLHLDVLGSRNCFAEQ